MLGQTDILEYFKSNGYDVMHITSKFGAVINGKVGREEFFNVLQSWGGDDTKKFVIFHYSILSEGINAGLLTLFCSELPIVEMAQTIGRVIRVHKDDRAAVAEGKIPAGAFYLQEKEGGEYAYRLQNGQRYCTTFAKCCQSNILEGALLPTADVPVWQCPLIAPSGPILCHTMSQQSRETTMRHYTKAQVVEQFRYNWKVATMQDPSIKGDKIRKRMHSVTSLICFASVVKLVSTDETWTNLLMENLCHVQNRDYGISFEQVQEEYPDLPIEQQATIASQRFWNLTMTASFPILSKMIHSRK